MARPKKAKNELATLDDCNRALAELRGAAAELRATEAERDLAVAKASAAFEKLIDEAKARANEATASLQAYYYGHLAELEREGSKHVQLANGRFGRRDNPPALKRLNGKWSWPDIENAVRAMFGRKYFRVREDLDRVALKDAQLAAETLRQLGVKVEADETFYVEPAALPTVGECR
jgi:phage host-nuclease inhibitor protein Gam